MLLLRIWPPSERERERERERKFGELTRERARKREKGRERERNVGLFHISIEKAFLECLAPPISASLT